ncbi:GspE/PulE family protein [Desulfonatronospira sp.]|uniref:GspE/PulE family protein n=1 Tax=Desulfonatronospira sp. TaxID=1962951 RepID=UPI0025B96E5A|nr:GspE/PulE family protein [Desulfonatronospira sp.]
MNSKNEFDLSALPGDIVTSYLQFPQRNQFLPVSLDEDRLMVLVTSVQGRCLADHLAWKLGKLISTRLVNQDLFYSLLEQALSLWEEEHDSGDSVEQEADSEDFGRDLLGWSHEDAPIVRLVNKALHQAVSQGASDIHFELQGKQFVIRYRLDGKLSTVRSLDPAVQPTVLARIKVMGSMDVAECRAPQDGRFQVRVGNKDIDLRVSTMPTLRGEKAVLRILDRSKNILSLPELGLEGEDIDLLRQIMFSPYGIILVTGPTGSGKTTSLYAALAELPRDSLNIMTVEDPVEYHLPGVNQVQVNRAAGVTFAGAVRGFLRQDPDIILVGEIRDMETASTAVQASLTGHLVLATLHTNDAPTAITRLLEMGIEPFLLASSMILVVGQRLVRKNCPVCSRQVPVSGDCLSMLQNHHARFSSQYRGQGCEACLHSGYKGRQGIYELMPVNEELRSLMIQKPSAEELRSFMRSKKNRSMFEHGLSLVQKGSTSLEEVLRVTRF